ncbi:MAG TPA: tetratricopeptide repeat protein, partial [Terriglobales bacterium]|nr:tetratricopeptide repeat protein [Terriglobales bacterium]
MKTPAMILLSACLPLIGLADVPARTSPPSGQIFPAISAEEDYQQGVRYATGEGVPRDYSLAAKYYRLAAEKGLSDAQYDLAYLYELGLGVKRDLKLAAEWYRKAALKGDAEAQNNLGVLY